MRLVLRISPKPAPEPKPASYYWAQMEAHSKKAMEEAAEAKNRLNRAIYNKYEHQHEVFARQFWPN